MDEGTELEKAPAAVAVKVVRKASGRVQKGRAINVSYGMRSIKMIAPRRNRNVKKEIRLGEESKTIKKHVSRLFMARCEEGNAKEVDTSYLEAYQKRWENIEVGIDLALEKVVKPVCERTLEVAQDLDQTSCIPQLVPVIFHFLKLFECRSYIFIGGSIVCPCGGTDGHQSIEFSDLTGAVFIGQIDF